MAKSEAARAKKSRAKLKSNGQREIRFKVSEAEYQRLEQMGKLRCGNLEPYTVADYTVTLLRTILPMDEAKYQEQLKKLGKCAFCKSVLPSGCGGAFKGYTECYHTTDYKNLEL